MSSRVEQVLVAGAILCCLMASVAWAAEEEEQQEVAEGRTFGHHFLKRLSFATVPAAFVIGVITTLLSALTIVSMKGLGVGEKCVVVNVVDVCLSPPGEKWQGMPHGRFRGTGPGYGP
ncbi:conserved hypothetical protein [Culex quinquefasciatus]|uniref:Uncharacterized protein n=1 Tax=Culex quinquefasciatus TaxID=7176 RepID=B0WVN2_CULQU|nr:conserved hypothetical protein [Culex quinquefasciatus]|eukprot:XP_001861454.1 conserved hypothetical protein [Culex quinquefasciatus]